MSHPVKVKILDQEYLLESEEDQNQVHKIAQYVNEKLKEVKENTQGLSERRAAILASLNIASEYFQLLKEKDNRLESIKERTELLIRSIDSVME